MAQPLCKHAGEPEYRGLTISSHNGAGEGLASYGHCRADPLEGRNQSYVGPFFPWAACSTDMLGS